MKLVHVHNRATGAYAHVPAKSLGLWGTRGWEAVNPEPPETEDSAAEADETAESHSSRGKPSARTTKDK